MSSIDIGKIKFTWRGNYDVATTYEAEDIVYSSGSTWICVATSPVTGSAPCPSNPDWNKISQGSDLGSIQNLASGDMLYFDGNDFVRLPVPSERLVLTQESGIPTWGYGPYIHSVHYEHFDQQPIANGGYYYWGVANQYDLNITTKMANSNVMVQIRWFGEPDNHNTSGRVYMCVDDESTAAWNYLALTTFGQNYHMKLDYYEATGTDYSSTPKQGSYQTVVPLSYPAGTKLSFRMLVGNGGTMRFNAAWNTSYESCPSTITLTELHPDFSTVVRNGSFGGF